MAFVLEFGLLSEFGLSWKQFLFFFSFSSSLSVSHFSLISSRFLRMIQRIKAKPKAIQCCSNQWNSTEFQNENSALIMFASNDEETRLKFHPFCLANVCAHYSIETNFIIFFMNVSWCRTLHVHSHSHSFDSCFVSHEKYTCDFSTMSFSIPILCSSFHSTGNKMHRKTEKRQHREMNFCRKKIIRAKISFIYFNAMRWTCSQKHCWCAKTERKKKAQLKNCSHNYGTMFDVQQHAFAID